MSGKYVQTKGLNRIPVLVCQSPDDGDSKLSSNVDQ
jgi:hypothetical protein